MFDEEAKLVDAIKMDLGLETIVERSVLLGMSIGLITAAWHTYRDAENTEFAE